MLTIYIKSENNIVKIDKKKKSTLVSSSLLHLGVEMDINDRNVYLGPLYVDWAQLPLIWTCFSDKCSPEQEDLRI